MKSLIIDRPDRMSLRQKYADNLMKVFLVLGWLYLGIPALTFAAWYIAYTFFNQHLLLLEGYKEYNTQASFCYIAIVVAMLVLLLVWSKGNQFFAKTIREDDTDTQLSIKESCHYYQLAEEDVVRYRTMKSMIVTINEQGQIDGVEKSS